MPTREIFRRRLREARTLRKLSQIDLADRAGLQQAAVSQYESGSRRPSLANLRKLGDALEVTTDFLLGRFDDPGTPATPDEPLLRDFERLTASDREVARDLVARLAQRGRTRRS
jgi:transcriptional regulator with XRE-family HTH domain